MPTHVYEQTNPRCGSEPKPGEYVYVGVTDDFIIRHGQHVRGNDASGKRLQWLLSLRRERLLPAIRIRETLETREAALERETHWIHEYQERGCIVLNDRKRDHSLDDLEFLNNKFLECFGPSPSFENYFGEPD